MTGLLNSVLSSIPPALSINSSNSNKFQINSILHHRHGEDIGSLLNFIECYASFMAFIAFYGVYRNFFKIYRTLIIKRTR